MQGEISSYPPTTCTSLHFIYHQLCTNLLDFLSLRPPIFCKNRSTSFMFAAFFQLVVVLAGRYGHQCLWPALCCDCLPEICINKLPVPACPRCCPGARTFAYRAVIGLPWVPSATAERVGGRQHHKWVLNWNLTAALHFMCVKARSKAESDQREKEEIKRRVRERSRQAHGRRHKQQDRPPVR